MLKSDFPSNYTGLYGRSNYLHRELLLIREYAEMHPQSAAELGALLAADYAVIAAAITAAASRDEMSGPGGGPLPVEPEPDPDPED